MTENNQGLRVGQKNILLVVRWPVGGIRTFLKYLISNFPSTRYCFFVVGVGTEGMSALRAELDDRVKGWVLIPPGGNEVGKIALAVWRLNRTYHFDVIHAHGFTSVVSCAHAGLTSRATIICTSHDVLHESNFSGFRGFIRKQILAFALGQCKLVHSVSRDAESNLLSYFPFLRSKSFAIKNGIDTSIFRCSGRADLHNEIGLKPSVKLIGFFGRFMAQKGFKHLVSAAGILKSGNSSLDFHIVCFGSGGFIREEQEQIQRLGLQTLFTFFPFIPDVSAAMKGCDLIAMPSLWEACPLQPMEALCAGVPFVGSNCIGLSEVLEGTPAMQSIAGDAKSLANGILQSLERGKEPFEKFAPVAAERFDVRKTAVNIYELYEKVIG